MTTTYLRDASGKTIRALFESGDRITVKTPGGQTLGWYAKSSNSTHNASGRLIAYGNITSSI